MPSFSSPSPYQHTRYFGETPTFIPAASIAVTMDVHSKYRLVHYDGVRMGWFATVIGSGERILITVDHDSGDEDAS